ncbi:MAG TPA: hypothetical protein PLU30_24545 [Verrucomicrobiae bacterium]|nr:hypothetical protein [Verrucomicrobiae bacterium]
MGNPLRFTEADAIRAADAWRFNCGPGALCAVLDLTPDEIRPKLAGFERKGYTNPTLMAEILTGCGARFHRVFRSDAPGEPFPALRLGLIRIQWGGPWTRPGVPMMARYRKTHWIAARRASQQIFDINCMGVGGWIDRHCWTDNWAPWIAGSCVEDSDGTWWPTHAIEVDA